MLQEKYQRLVVVTEVTIIYDFKTVGTLESIDTDCIQCIHSFYLPTVRTEV